VLQLFDSWVGCLSPSDYVAYVEPFTRRIFDALSGGEGRETPLIHFGVNTATLLPYMADDGASVIGVDWRIPLDVAWGIIGRHRAIQGNLDPAVLLGPPAVIEREIHDVLARAAGCPGHIFNLGHGLLPQTPVAHVERAVEAIKLHAATGERPSAAIKELAGASA